MSAEQADHSDNISEPSVKAPPTEAASSEPAVAASDAGNVEAPNPVPAQHRSAASDDGAAMADAGSPDSTEQNSAKQEPVKQDTAKPDRPESRTTHQPGKIMVMSPVRGENWGEERIGHDPSQSSSGGKRRAAALTTVVALAALFGVVGGAVATAGLGYLARDTASVAQRDKALEESIQRIESDLAVLKGNVEKSTQLSASQASRFSDRLDRVEKAQAEPAARIAKLSETVEKLRAAPPPAPSAPVATTPAAPRESTGSLATNAPVPAQTAPKPEVSRLPKVEGWVLRDVSDGAAVIQGRQGIFEVYAGDPVPGLGRVDAIRRQDGRWVVVTSRGLIVAR